MYGRSNISIIQVKNWIPLRDPSGNIVLYRNKNTGDLCYKPHTKMSDDLPLPPPPPMEPESGQDYYDSERGQYNQYSSDPDTCGYIPAGGVPYLPEATIGESLKEALERREQMDVSNIPDYNYEKDYDSVQFETTVFKTKRSVGKKYIAIYSFDKRSSDELSFNHGDILTECREKTIPTNDGYIEVQNLEGHVGLAPINYLQDYLQTNPVAAPRVKYSKPMSEVVPYLIKDAWNSDSDIDDEEDDFKDFCDKLKLANETKRILKEHGMTNLDELGSTNIHDLLAIGIKLKEAKKIEAWSNTEMKKFQQNDQERKDFSVKNNDTTISESQVPYDELSEASNIIQGYLLSYEQGLLKERKEQMCMFGDKMVEWLVAEQDVTPEKAVGMWQSLLEVDLIAHVEEKYQFQNKKYFYQFVQEKEKPKLSERKECKKKLPKALALLESTADVVLQRMILQKWSNYRTEEDISGIVELIMTLNAFKEFSAILRDVAALVMIETYLEDSIVFKKGQPSDYWYVILSGKVTEKTKGKTLSWISGEGFGRPDNTDKRQTQAEVASDVCHILKISKDDFIFLNETAREEHEKPKPKTDKEKYDTLCSILSDKTQDLLSKNEFDNFEDLLEATREDLKEIGISIPQIKKIQKFIADSKCDKTVAEDSKIPKRQLKIHPPKKEKHKSETEESEEELEINDRSKRSSGNSVKSFKNKCQNSDVKKKQDSDSDYDDDEEEEEEEEDWGDDDELLGNADAIREYKDGKSEKEMKNKKITEESEEEEEDETALSPNVNKNKITTRSTLKACEPRGKYQNAEPKKKSKTKYLGSPNSPYNKNDSAQDDALARKLNKKDNSTKQQFYAIAGEEFGLIAYFKRLGKKLFGTGKQPTTTKRGAFTVHKLPLSEVYRDEEHKIRFCKIGDANPIAESKNILLVGQTGSGKSTMIEGMVNYLYKIDFDTQYRLSLIDLQHSELGKSSAQSQTEWITAYTIPPSEYTMVKYPVTIVDMPGFGDTRGIKYDEALIKSLSKLFNTEGAGGITTIDAICFVAKATEVRLTPEQHYIFNSILDIFGKDIKENIHALISFIDNPDTEPLVIGALDQAKVPYEKAFKFNNDAVYPRNTGAISAAYWEMGIKGYNDFFSHLDTAKAKSVVLTQQTLNARAQINTKVKSLEEKLQSKMNKIKENHVLEEKLKEKIIEKCNNEGFKVVIPKEKFEKILTKKDSYVIYCKHCKYECQHDSHIDTNDKIEHSVLMDEDGQCEACRNHCAWDQHESRNYFLRKTEIRVEIFSQEKKEIYERAKKSIADIEIQLDPIRAERDKLNEEANELLAQITECMETLRKIALKKQPATKVDYLKRLLQDQLDEQAEGWQGRKAMLEEMIAREVIISKIANGDDLSMKTDSNIES